MKKLVFPILLALVFAGCNPKYLDPSVIEIYVDTVRATQIQITFTPEKEDAYYFLGLIYKSDIRQYGSLDTLVQTALDYMSKVYNDMQEEGYVYSSFEDSYLYSRRVKKGFYYLEPNTTYVVFAVQVNPVDRKIMGDIKWAECLTPDLQRSDLKFNIWTDRDTINIIPTNDDPYFWDYIAWSEINEHYDGNMATYLYEMIDMFEEYGFMDNMVTRGAQRIVITDDDPSMRDGEEYVFCAMGYNGEINTDVDTYMFSYENDQIVKFHSVMNENTPVSGREIVRRGKDIP